MNAIGTEDAKLAFVKASEINQTATTLAGAREGYLMNRSSSLQVLVFDQYERLTFHRRRQTQVGEFDDLAEGRLL